MSRLGGAFSTTVEFAAPECVRAGGVGARQHHRRRTALSRSCHQAGRGAATAPVHQSRNTVVVLAQRHVGHCKLVSQQGSAAA